MYGETWIKAGGGVRTQLWDTTEGKRISVCYKYALDMVHVITANKSAKSCLFSLNWTITTGLHHPECIVTKETQHLQQQQQTTSFPSSFFRLPFFLFKKKTVITTIIVHFLFSVKESECYVCHSAFLRYCISQHAPFFFLHTGHAPLFLTQREQIDEDVDRRCYFLKNSEKFSTVGKRPLLIGWF